MRDHIEDLSVHARRGELGEGGRRVLSIALRSSREALLLHEAGCAFDELDSILPGDDAVARRVINRIMVSRQRSRRRRPRYAQLALIGLAWTAAAAAAAPLLKSSEVSRPVVWNETSTGERVAEPRSARKDLAEPRWEPPAISAPVAPSPVEKSKANTTSIAMTRRPSAVAHEFSSSVRAFAEANRLRRLGRVSEAISQYHFLQRSFPGSHEARNADIALGMLRLQTGAARDGLVHFRRYLNGNPGSQLIPEALFGEAQALDALGRRDAALRSYSSLLHRYPDSAYAGAAKAKLQSAR